MKKKKLIKHINHLDSMVGFLVDYMDSQGLLDDGCFTFPDGETIWSSRKRTEENKRLNATYGGWQRYDTDIADWLRKELATKIDAMLKEELERASVIYCDHRPGEPCNENCRRE